MVGMQTSTATMENSGRFLKKLELELPYFFYLEMLLSYFFISYNSSGSFVKLLNP